MKAATPEGTNAYLNARAGGGVSRKHFRLAQDLWVSSVGLGTYLGAIDDETDGLYREAIIHAVLSGLNVLDTSINYRCQRSERIIGEALRNLAGKGVGRDQVVIATKAGFIPFDAEPPADTTDYLNRSFFVTGILEPSEVVAGCHAMTPRYLENQLEKSLANLGVEAIDIYYLHNPETQLSEVSREEFARRLRAAFEFLEKAAAAGKVHFYGASTWNALRQPPEVDDYLSLETVVSLARDVGGEKHRFRFIQLPFNLAMTEALTDNNQPVKGNMLSTLLAAEELGLTVMSSASISQGRLTQGLPEWLGKLLKGLTTDAQRSIQFARSAPGLTTALVGMKQIKHVEENLAVARIAPTPLEDLLKLFEVDGQS